LTKALLNCQPMVTVDWFRRVSCYAEPHIAIPLTDLWARSRHITFYNTDEPYPYSTHLYKRTSQNSKFTLSHAFSVPPKPVMKHLIQGSN
jgi:hypothetical protein